MPKQKSESPLKPDEILTAEFQYIADSAFQANEDRSKAASFFLVSVGSLVAAIFGAQELSAAKEVPLTLYFVLAGLFFVLSLLGGLTVTQLARLRAAWYESALAMNEIKEYYSDHFGEIELYKAFRWKKNTMPSRFKLNSISFSTALEVALLSGLTFGASTYFFQQGIRYSSHLWIVTLLCGLFALSLQLYFYWRLLK